MTTLNSPSLVTRDTSEGGTTPVPAPLGEDGGGAGSNLVRVMRPRGVVVHYYRGRLTPSGRRTPRDGGRAVCNTRTGVLWVEETMGPLDPDSRRLCRRCALVASPGAATSSGTGPVSPWGRDEWSDYASRFTPSDLAGAAWLASTPAELHRVELLALLNGVTGADTKPVWVLSQARPLWVWVEQARTRLGITDPHALQVAADLENARHNATLTRRARARQARVENVTADQLAGRYVPSFMTG